MQEYELTGFGEHAGKLGPVKDLIELYRQSEYPGLKTIVIKKLIAILDDCPLYITDLLIAEAIKQLRIDTSLAVLIVSERYKEIIRSLMAEVREVSKCLEQKM